MIELVDWGGWPCCYRLTNGAIEAIITTAIGPRIVRYGFIGGQNFMLELPGQVGTAGEAEFLCRGGHRLWVAPERAGTYAPDNLPCDHRVAGEWLEVTGPVEPGTGFRKQLRLRMDEAGRLHVIHRLQNTLEWGVEVCIWTLTMMAAGGVGVSGFPPRGTHPECLPPTNPLVMWAFSDLTDSRLTLTKKHLVLRQDAKRADPNKFGLFNINTWGAYLLGEELFIKQSQSDPSRTYCDFGASFEIWTNADTLELETLSPIILLQPQQWLEHLETWSLHSSIKISQWTDGAIDEAIGNLHF